MNQLALNKSPKNHNGCDELIRMAEKELAAFFTAVTDLFGSEQAELSAKEWLRELLAINYLPASTRELRQLTIKASARLARVNPDRSSAERVNVCA
jgi:hypothetical protein